MGRREKRLVGLLMSRRKKRMKERRQLVVRRCDVPKEEAIVGIYEVKSRTGILNRSFQEVPDWVICGWLPDEVQPWRRCHESIRAVVSG